MRRIRFMRFRHTAFEISFFLEMTIVLESISKSFEEEEPLKFFVWIYKDFWTSAQRRKHSVIDIDAVAIHFKRLSWA